MENKKIMSTKWIGIIWSKTHIISYFRFSFFSRRKKMKVLFLCAGYGTRLERDLQSSGEFSECLGRPKALLPIGEKALISYWFESLDNLEAADMVDEIIIVTNEKFNEQFYKSRKW